MLQEKQYQPAMHKVMRSHPCGVTPHAELCQRFLIYQERLL